MNQLPLVTIVTPSYNQGKYIEETILSVLNQSYKNFEYFVIDGGSTDNSMEIINRYRAEIDLIIHKKDNGQTDAINKGFRLAKGEIVGWINSDDSLSRDCVERVVETFSIHMDASIAYFNNLNLVDKNGVHIKNVNRRILGKNYLLNHNYSVIQPGSFYRTQYVRQIDYLNVEKRYCMDLDLWLRLLDLGTLYGIPNGAGANFRVWSESKTQTNIKAFLREIRVTTKENGARNLSLNRVRMLYEQFMFYLSKV